MAGLALNAALRGGRAMGPALAKLIGQGKNLLTVGEQMGVGGAIRQGLVPGTAMGRAWEAAGLLLPGAMTYMQTGDPGAAAGAMLTDAVFSGLGRVGGSGVAFARNRNKRMSGEAFGRLSQEAADMGSGIGSLGSMFLPAEMIPGYGGYLDRMQAEQDAMFTQAVNQQVQQMAPPMPQPEPLRVPASGVLGDDDFTRLLMNLDPAMAVF